MPQLVLVDAPIEVEHERHGVSAHELLDLRPEGRRWITATALEAWLRPGRMGGLVSAAGGSRRAARPRRRLGV